VLANSAVIEFDAEWQPGGDERARGQTVMSGVPETAIDENPDQDFPEAQRRCRTATGWAYRGSRRAAAIASDPKLRKANLSRAIFNQGEWLDRPCTIAQSEVTTPPDLILP
jgi:hypothetical protein